MTTENYRELQEEKAQVIHSMYDNLADFFEVNSDILTYLMGFELHELQGMKKMFTINKN